VAKLIRSPSRRFGTAVDGLPDLISDLRIHCLQPEADTGMGKGDQRTKRGKRFRGTHGKTRPRKKKKTAQKKG
jgi:ribosomal small subunit protein bTHX